MIYNFMEDNYYTEITIPDEGYVTRTQIKENKMTREEAKNMANHKGYSVEIIDLLSELGLIKFEESGDKTLMYKEDDDDCWHEVDIELAVTKEYNIRGELRKRIRELEKDYALLQELKKND